MSRVWQWSRKKKILEADVAEAVVKKNINEDKLVESKNEAPLFDNHGNVQQNSKAEAERRCQDLRNFYVRVSIRLGGLWFCTE